MTVNDKAALVLTILSILGIFLAGLRWFMRADIKDIVREIVMEEIKVVRHELTNNGGSSTKDKIDFIYNHLKKDE